MKACQGHLRVKVTLPIPLLLTNGFSSTGLVLFTAESLREAASQPHIRNVCLDAILNPSALVPPITRLPCLVLAGREVGGSVIHGSLRGCTVVLHSSGASCTNHLVTLKQLGEKSLSANPWNSHSTPMWEPWIPVWQRTQPGLIQGLASAPEANSQAERWHSCPVEGPALASLWEQGGAPLESVWQHFSRGHRCLRQTWLRTCRTPESRRRSSGRALWHLLGPHCSCIMVDLCCVVEVPATLIDDSDLQRGSHPWGRRAFIKATPGGTRQCRASRGPCPQLRL